MMLRTLTLAALIALGAAPHAAACALPPPVCEVSNGQIAVLDHANGNTVLFSQVDPDAEGYAPTYVLVDCTKRQAVALGHLPEGADDAALQTHFQGRRVMDRELGTGARPRLREVHRQLQRMGLRSKRFTLMKSHCGCALPDMPPPPSSCPPY